MHHEDWEVFYMKKKMAMFLALTLSLGCIGTACGSSKKADADTKKENTKTVTADEVSEEETLLSGSHIAVVGSTLTVGNGKTSYTDYLEKKNGMTVDVFAKKDATLTGDGEQSYKAQLDAMDKDATWDMILVEIPPTETDKKAEVGELSESEDRDTYDLETLTGAYQYIVSYCWETWKAPVVLLQAFRREKKITSMICVRLSGRSNMAWIMHMSWIYGKNWIIRIRTSVHTSRKTERLVMPVT